MGQKPRAHLTTNAVSTTTFVVPFITGLLIFAATAIIGAWSAPTPSLALPRLGFIMAGLILLAGLPQSSKGYIVTLLTIVNTLCCLLAVVIGGYFLLTHNQTNPVIPTYPLHNNLVGGIIIILLPFCIAAIISSRTQRLQLTTLTMVCVVLFSLVTLAITGSRGAWIGLGSGIIFERYLHWRRQNNTYATLHRVADLALIGGLLACIAIYWVAITMPGYSTHLEFLTNTNSVSRVQLWRDSLPLIQDYLFTGSGLGNTTMAYSSYIFLLHVPFLYHAHNLYLQIAIEQGLPGLIAFLLISTCVLGMLLRIYQYNLPQIRHQRTATTIALIAMLIHGTVDSELYTHPLLGIMFLPLAMVITLFLYSERRQMNEPGNTGLTNRAALIGVIGSTLILLLGVSLAGGNRAALLANLGAVSQTKAELSIYSWPEWPLQDEIRRSNAADLNHAIAQYETALAIDPNYETAHRRLGQIAISKGDYAAAKTHLEAAYLQAPNHRATRQLLGEVYAVTGNPNEARLLWQTVDLDQGQLDLRVWWYNKNGTAQELRWLKEAAKE